VAAGGATSCRRPSFRRSSSSPPRSTSHISQSREPFNRSFDYVASDGKTPPAPPQAGRPRAQHRRREKPRRAGPHHPEPAGRRPLQGKLKEYAPGRPAGQGVAR
jgi:hypothetical protein